MYMWYMCRYNFEWEIVILFDEKIKVTNLNMAPKVDFTVEAATGR